MRISVPASASSDILAGGCHELASVLSSGPQLHTYCLPGLSSSAAAPTRFRASAAVSRTDASGSLTASTSAELGLLGLVPQPAQGPGGDAADLRIGVAQRRGQSRDRRGAEITQGFGRFPRGPRVLAGQRFFDRGQGRRTDFAQRPGGRAANVFVRVMQGPDQRP